MDNFGNNLKKLRKARGFSQRLLAEKIGTTRRTVDYYEREAGHPPGKILSALAEELEVPVNVLLGIEPFKQDMRTIDAKFWPKWQQLPEEDKKVISKLTDSLLAKA